jgi:hypothetical protein
MPGSGLRENAAGKQKRRRNDGVARKVVESKIK